MENNEIRFIDSHYNELFRIKDGESITVKFSDGSMSDRKCTYTVGRVDQFHTLIAHIPELSDKRLHITVSTGRHQIVDGKRSAFFQHAQCFQQKRLLVFPRNVVIDIVAGHRIEALVGKIQLHGVPTLERNVFHALRRGVFFA